MRAMNMSQEDIMHAIFAKSWAMQWRMEDVDLGSITKNHIYIEPTSESES